ncbi:MAG: class I SAM-dependent methyltransferase [Oscillospiraceae bacterium]|nr:class I SAM-dependent methyltransferase [Oscillospiraceae bacterium]
MTDPHSRSIQDFYNDIADDFAETWYANDSLLGTLRYFLSLLPPAPRVLDLGCGAGYESMRLRGLGAEVVGVDYSEAPLKIAREKNPDCRFERMDFRQLGPALGQFDGIAAIASLIHIPDGELEQVFRGMRSVLVPGGFALVILVEGEGLSAERSFLERGGKHYDRYFYLHSRARLDAAAQAAGLAFFEEITLPENNAKGGWKCFLYH